MVGDRITGKAEAAQLVAHRGMVREHGEDHGVEVGEIVVISQEAATFQDRDAGHGAAFGRRAVDEANDLDFVAL